MRIKIAVFILIGLFGVQGVFGQQIKQSTITQGIFIEADSAIVTDIEDGVSVFIEGRRGKTLYAAVIETEAVKPLVRAYEKLSPESWKLPPQTLIPADNGKWVLRGEKGSEWLVEILSGGENGWRLPEYLEFKLGEGLPDDDDDDDDSDDGDGVVNQEFYDDVVTMLNQFSDPVIKDYAPALAADFKKFANEELDKYLSVLKFSKALGEWNYKTTGNKGEQIGDSHYKVWRIKFFEPLAKRLAQVKAEERLLNPRDYKHYLIDISVALSRMDD